MLKLIAENFDLHTSIVSSQELDKILEGMDKKKKDKKKDEENINIPDEVRTLLKQEGTAVIKVIQSGWSKNRNYYSTEVLAKLPQAMENARIQFLNHSEEDSRQRDTKELASFSDIVWYDSVTESVYASVYFPQTKQDTAWLYEVAERSPEVVGASIASYVEVEEDFKYEGITGYRVLNWEEFQSFDYVLFPSAGGRAVATESVKESIESAKKHAKDVKMTSEVITREYESIHKYIRSLEGKIQDYVDDNIHKSYFWSVLDALSDLFYEILFWRESNDTETLDEKLKTAFDEAYKILAELPFVKNDGKIKQEGIMPITIEQLQKEAPELLKQIEENVLAGAKTKELAESVDSFKSEVKELTERVSALSTEKEKLEAEKKELSEKLASFEEKERKAEKEKAYDAAVAKHFEENKLPVDVLTDSFKERVLKLDKEEIDAEIKDRAEMLNKAVNGNSYESSGYQNDKHSTEEDLAEEVGPSDFMN